MQNFHRRFNAMSIAYLYRFGYGKRRAANAVEAARGPDLQRFTGAPKLMFLYTHISVPFQPHFRLWGDL